MLLKHHRTLKKAFGCFPSRRTYYGNASSVGKQKHCVDLRSDTVTKPSEEMLHVMLQADKGDDVMGENETVNLLQSTCASLFGMENSVFVPSGTMGNLLALMTHVQRRGEELIIGSKQHVYCYEQNHFSQFASIPSRVITNQSDGTMLLSDIDAAISDDSDSHCCATRLICLENTHMLMGGIPLPIDYVHQVAKLAQSKNIKLHIDGARIYNAAVAHDVPIKDLLKGVDSVSMCLSKGLGCPVGSVVGGSDEFIKNVVRLRKAVGGGMRQSGFLAAAGLFALERAHQTLQADHTKAQKLAHGVNSLSIDDVSVNIENVKTNIVFMQTKQGKAAEIVFDLRKHNLLCTAFSSSIIRFVTHCDVSLDDIDMSLDIIETCLGGKDRTKF